LHTFYLRLNFVAKVLSGAEIPESRDVVDETAVPEDVELVLEQLFEALQDKVSS